MPMVCGFSTEHCTSCDVSRPGYTRVPDTKPSPELRPGHGPRAMGPRARSASSRQEWLLSGTPTWVPPRTRITSSSRKSPASPDRQAIPKQPHFLREEVSLLQEERDFLRQENWALRQVYAVEPEERRRQKNEMEALQAQVVGQHDVYSRFNRLMVDNQKLAAALASLQIVQAEHEAQMTKLKTEKVMQAQLIAHLRHQNAKLEESLAKAAAKIATQAYDRAQADILLHEQPLSLGGSKDETSSARKDRTVSVSMEEHQRVLAKAVAEAEESALLRAEGRDALLADLKGKLGEISMLARSIDSITFGTYEPEQ